LKKRPKTMNHVYRTVWSVARQCYVAASEMSRARGKTSGVKSAALMSSQLVSLSSKLFAGVAVAVSSASAQELAVQYAITENGGVAAANSTIPSAGIAGQGGRSGTYRCTSSMQWGQACVNWYSFGSYVVVQPANGRDAPSSGVVSTLSSTSAAVVGIEEYNPATVVTNGFTVTVSRLAGTTDYETISSEDSLTASEIINAGQSFRVTGTNQNGDPFTVNFPETLVGGVVTGGYTLAQVRDSINAADIGLTAVVVEEKNASGLGTGKFLLKLRGLANSSDSFTAAIEATGSVTGQVAGSALTNMSFSTRTTDSEPISALYSVSGAITGNGSQTASGNIVTVDGVEISLKAVGSSTINSSQSNAGSATGGTGVAGAVGVGITQALDYNSILVPSGSAFNFQTIGEAGGSAGVGGAGGVGGVGANAYTGTVPRIGIYLLFTVPDTDAVTARGGVGGAGAQGGIGGAGLSGGVGGAINVTLSANSVTADTLSTMTSTGGQGGAGGVGGPGGMGGAGGNAAAAVEANDFIPFVKSDLGNTGGIGGTGGLGGNGGTGGAGGSVVLNTTFTQAIAMNGQQATSLGGKGGSGGQGGQGGQGGTGGLGVAMSVGIGTGVENGSAGGLAGAGFTGGQGGIGGAGGAVTLTNQGGDLVVSNIGLLALSQGGEGGTGGQGGQGGTGGSGGNGRGAAVLGVNDVVSNGGAAGDGFTAGVGGSAGMGGAGGSASISNLGLNGSIVAGVNAIHATSRGGIGGIGGKGGTGGTGGTGGLPGLVNPIAERGYGGRAGLSGAGGNGGNGSAGGNGAAGGNGGVVSVINEQSLRTVGTSYASAILGESLGAIGGVGGLGGDAGAGGQGGPGGSVSDTTSGFIGGASCIGQTLTGGGCTVTLNWAAGASGNAGIASTSVGVTSFTGGNGSSVTIANSGTIRTAGLNSDAIMAISMGGVHGLSDYNPNNVYRNGLVKNISNQVMSQTGGAGNVSSTNTGGTIVTTGDRSSAIMSLSVGAGYGAGTATAANTGRLETLGNDSPAMVAASRVYALAGLTGANAANVTATNNAGTIVTSGAASHGIEAESWSEIGAAGSVIVNSNSGYIGLFGSGNVSAIRALSHAQGDSAAAGDVTVTNRSGQIISTTAGSAYTVDAHSISADGNAGAVSFDNTGGYLWSNSTAGSVYLGSLLQGTVGSRTSGAVSATNASSIISTAFGSTALTLESVTGNLVVSNGGLIQGGATGSAISFVGGNNNTITNDDSIDPQDTARLLTFGSVQDVVIRATGGNDTVNNLNGAYIRGSIHLGTGSNALNNNSTALGAKSLIESGSVVNLGGGTFTNGARGYWSPGGLGVILSPSTDGGRAANGVTLTGNFVQQAGGHLVMDVNYASGSSRVDYGDHISVTGTATLGGFVTLRPSTGAAKQGQRTITLLTATGGITATPTISIHPFFAKDDYSDGVPSTTAIFTPSLEVAGNNLNLVYDVDYTPNYLTPNQNAVANQIINIQNTGVPTYQLIAGQLLNITDPVDYQKALDSLSGEGVTATQQATFAARGRFADTTLSSATALLVCDEELKSQDPEACDRGARRWAVMDSTKMTQKGNLNEAGTATTIGSFFAGFEGRLNSFSVLGVSFGYSKGTFAVDNRWTSGQSDSLNTSLYYAAQASNGWGAKAMVLGGLTQNQYQRFAMGNKVKGESDSYSLGYGLELFYRGSVGFLNVSPFVSVFNDRQHQAKHAEDDTQWGNDYKTQRVSSRPVTVGFTLDGKIGSGQHVLLPKLRYAVKQEKASLDRQLTAASLSAPDFYWTIDGVKPPKQQRLLELDMKLRLSQHTHISFKAHKNWSHGHMNKGGSLKLESSF
jgi:hypothetical protein